MFVNNFRKFNLLYASFERLFKGFVQPASLRVKNTEQGSWNRAQDYKYFFYAVFKINVKACKSFIELVLVLNQTRIHGPHLPIHTSSGVRRKLTYADPGNGFRILDPASRNMIVFQGSEDELYQRYLCDLFYAFPRFEITVEPVYQTMISLTCISKCRKAETKNKLSTPRTPSNQLQSSLLRSCFLSRHATLLPWLRDEPKTAAWKTA